MPDPRPEPAAGFSRQIAALNPGRIVLAVDCPGAITIKVEDGCTHARVTVIAPQGAQLDMFGDDAVKLVEKTNINAREEDITVTVPKLLGTSAVAGPGQTVIQVAGQVTGDPGSVIVFNGPGSGADGSGGSADVASLPRVEATLPSGCEVYLTGKFGRITVTGRVVHANIRTLSGDVDIDTTDTARIVAAGGSVRVRHIVEGADISSTGGTVTFAGRPGARVIVNSVGADVTYGPALNASFRSVGGRISAIDG